MSEERPERDRMYWDPDCYASVQRWKLAVVVAGCLFYLFDRLL